MSEKLDRYHEYRRAETGLKQIRQHATELRSVPRDPDEAESAVELFGNQIDKVIDSFPELARVTLVTEGTDVLIPGVTASSEASAVHFTIEPEEPYKVYGNLVPIEGRLATILTNPDVKTEDGRIQFGARMYLAHIHKPSRIALGQAPYIDIQRTDYISAPLATTADAHIGVKQLEQLREQKEAFLELSKNGLSRTVYAKMLHKLSSALATEREHFVQLNDVEMLHKIGRLGKKYADESGLHDKITEPLTKTLGAGRQVTITTDCVLSFDKDGDLCQSDGKLKGRIIDVCADLRGFNPDALIVIVEDFKDTSTHGYVPLDQIKEFWF
jgi:hypothetical protein